MADIKGTHTRNTSKDLGFYISYTVTDEPASLRLRLDTSAWFWIGSWGFSGVESGASVTVKAGGTSKSFSLSGGNYASHNQWYKLGGITTYHNYGTTDTSVKISATTTDIYCAGYGPGKCSAETTVKVATGCSTAGSISVTINGEDSATWKATGLNSKSDYKRTVNWWLKLANSSSWVKCGSTPIAAGAAAGTPSYTKSGLIPGTTYNFDYTVYASTANTADHTKLFEKTVNGTTTAAAGALSLSNVTASGMTATITGMKSTSINTRTVTIYYKRSTASSWSLATTKTVAANTAAGSPSYTFSGLVPGAKYDVKAEFYIGSTLYKTTNTASCSLPFDSVSIPEVTSVSQTSPHPFITIQWHLSTVYSDSLSSTMFGVYIKRAGEPEILVETVSGQNMSSPYHVTTICNADGWLLDKEEITVYVKATNAYSSGPTVSNEAIASVTRCFYWDDAKVCGEVFGIDAAEWNKLKQFVNDAAVMYPDYFIEITSPDVSAGDIFTAVLANAAAYGSEITVDQYDTVFASDAMLVQGSLNERMKEATGL